ncbi:putative DNA-binding protein (MmcQ/YjbR family) [Providencia alcalifaciens]|uniref:Putative DNA-binding protein (MmcQ/YjbR family) n=1 Tax=Providencia alcalifaciens TaxID=126385 RepID=A0A4R3NCU1_9GAMM|nr:MULTISPECIES: MmcQ/YjbR family DNA-binding protein [Providencia]MBC5792391.1 MmcQ/YjbR family DNA-binding protein [Providencia sp. JUb39]TCT28814.1 putative DNA-binding protein (MmcQ/YjbR family) [Providencia alcalifaciens]
MNYDEFNMFCGSFPATSHVVQWGNSDVWKIGNTVFAIGGWSPEEETAFTFKVSDLNFDFLSSCSGYKPAPDFANRGMKWIQQIDTKGHLDEEVRYYLSESYKIIVSSLSKRKQVELGILCHINYTHITNSSKTGMLHSYQ